LSEDGTSKESERINIFRKGKIKIGDKEEIKSYNWMKGDGVEFRRKKEVNDKHLPPINSLSISKDEKN